ncbi:MAG TPA: cytochrome b/b6 domain-containing protein [Methylomusa anaerophila]|uniref:Prokaryotic cytochrome b561 n=1 Tax=Methylomusa anaerophila TaxID=1930071 RepID=A0A348AJF6_9FIRM|nr:cytochrome b/b6 domain-containing protein [Methylomusa anaerophila]BBB91204.1 prokaryotic cytochrome b561 [Methylomusa anaerophila]HML89801.1 cytochrome b/b6 domain-containing protein [Methylomusa anaerophila]
MKLLLHPGPVRFFHWIMFAAVTFLVVSGLYMSNPWGGLPYGLIRKLHNIAGIILLLNIGGQSYYYIMMGKFTEVIFLPRDLPNMRSFLRYTLFITENHPNYGRYSPGQKILFTSWWLAILLAGMAAIPLMLPAAGFSSGVLRMLGGLTNLQVIYYGIAMFFLTTIPFHLYLVFTEDPAKLQAMFSGYIKKEPKCSAEASDYRVK